MESILTSIKKLLGIEDEYEQFDADIIMLINSTLTDSLMLGVGPKGGFQIEDKSQTWGHFIGDRKDLGFIKEYIFYKVKLAFDPPQTGTLVEVIKERIKELEWKLNVQVETLELDSDYKADNVIFEPVS